SVLLSDVIATAEKVPCLLLAHEGLLCGVVAESVLLLTEAYFLIGFVQVVAVAGQGLAAPQVGVQRVLEVPHRVGVPLPVAELVQVDGLAGWLGRAGRACTAAASMVEDRLRVGNYRTVPCVLD